MPAVEFTSPLGELLVTNHNQIQHLNVCLVVDLVNNIDHSGSEMELCFFLASKSSGEFASEQGISGKLLDLQLDVAFWNCESKL